MNGWDWPGVVALAVSVLALGISWMAYRQRVRYHAQPKLVPSWERAELTHYEVPIRQLALTNYGDAVARDVVSLVPSSARGRDPWEKKAEIAPGETWWVMVPLVAGVQWGEGGMDRFFNVTSGDGKRVRPEVVVEWRQAPFRGPKRREVFRGPRD
ncbi:hypothetical protein J2Y69_001392 [Microbacterium resistens]|uniref:DUF58 domain-containing protein n=1 Tax=Microbacterium resistens TaxID=156977 RepID=A0ABU1SC29_9MICO|nr:hypothetical protein [Microbacterium resistens]MDR6866793.1 hypothetical protein [Microbacterium resistens]